MFYRGWQTNSMEQAESKTVDGSLSAQAAPLLVWNLKVRYTSIPPHIPNPEPDESSLHRPTPCSLNYVIITSTASSSERAICNERIVWLLHTRICLPLPSSRRLFFLGFLYEVKERTLIWRSCPSARPSAILVSAIDSFFHENRQCSGITKCAIVNLPVLFTLIV